MENLTEKVGMILGFGHHKKQIRKANKSKQKSAHQPSVPSGRNLSYVSYEATSIISTPLRWDASQTQGYTQS